MERIREMRMPAARQALDAVTEAVEDPARREPILRRLLHEIAEGLLKTAGSRVRDDDRNP